ncbi:uncharacterized protein KY384_002152 [Bacidia gigantensis]|uniref:uncharacterized protein n=1 Tax=Bacidia gigantensis TaxID=2732470 RepID=UPI001D04BD78|nr:uncharacterized protein KY384_002152 [Bacidia gigantensis]KAG8533369.1 hypothetical protein KY384_002152 [Bacidia gigantensis]
MDVDTRPAAANDPNNAMTTKSPIQITSQPPPSQHTPDAPSTKDDLPASGPIQPVQDQPRQNDETKADLPALAAAQGPNVGAMSARRPAQTSHLSMNLLSVFDLDPLVATVARFDAVTGEKINKMRKSYEGQAKSLGLAGKNKSIRHEDAVASGGGKMTSLKDLSSWPDEEWYNQKVFGKDIKKGLPESITSKLDAAFTINQGAVPDDKTWKEILGIETPNPANANLQKEAKINGKTAAPSGKAVNAEHAGANEHIRARRSTKKRRYDDDSYEGYNETFKDDEMDREGGYESAETGVSKNSRGSRGEKNKRRKTNEHGKGGGNSRTGSFASIYGR